MSRTPSSSAKASWLILKAMSVIYLIAFLSLAVQIVGLIGHDGILPIAPAIEELKQRLGWQAFFSVPTLCLWNSSDAFLQFLAWGGAGIAVLMFLGAAPALTSFLAWLFYLSLTTVGRDFLGFQWDNLLLETGVLTIAIAPLAWRPNFFVTSEPSRWVVWLWRLLLIKLMVQSGLVKILSGDPNWTKLEALGFHYWTQPLPNVISWYADKLPKTFHHASVAGVFFIELAVPILIFCGKRARLTAFFIFTFFQLLIILTGNYGFFNLLSIVIGLSLLDDRHLEWLKGKFEIACRWPAGVVLPLAFLVTLISFAQFAFMLRLTVPKPITAIIIKASPFRSVNNYGLFAVMTTQRHEIIIEGSQDGLTWLPYEFYWKPGDLKRRPGWVMPHQPRLDWQMWFAALGNYQQNQWVIALMARLAENSKSVTRLLKTNPFAGHPPRYMRAVLYDYHFTDLKTQKETGEWWRRTYLGLYTPVLQIPPRSP